MGFIIGLILLFPLMHIMGFLIKTLIGAPLCRLMHKFLGI